MTTTTQAKKNQGTAASGDWVDDLIDSLPPLLTLKETAKALRLSRRTIARYAADGRIRVRHHSPARCFVPRAEIERYLRALEHV